MDGPTPRRLAELVERNNGIFGGCWCVGCNPEHGSREVDVRTVKEDRVRTDRAHAALVLTCFYVDPRHRTRGIARVALEGALDQIAGAGGGLVEAISEVTTGPQAPGRFLFDATVELFENFGFTRGRQVGKHAWIVSKVVEAT